MSELLAALMSPGEMTQAQWLLLAIGLFILLGALYFVVILLRLLKGLGKSDYKPNIGLSRLEKQGYRPASVRFREHMEAEEDNEEETRQDKHEGRE